MKFNKKASLELSINAIVIVVLAFVMLGLALGFIKNQFTNIGDTTGSVQETVKQQILDQMREGNKKLSFPAQRLKIEKGKKEDIAVGVKNVNDGDLEFSMVIYTQKDDKETDPCGFDYTELTDLEGAGDEAADESGCDIGEIEYFYDTGVQTLSSTDVNVYGISITPGKDSGTYMAKILLLYEDNTDVKVYATKTFFIEVI